MNEEIKKDAAELSDNELENAVGGKKKHNAPYGNYPHHKYSGAYVWCTQEGITQSDFDKNRYGINNCSGFYHPEAYYGVIKHNCVYCNHYHEEDE